MNYNDVIFQFANCFFLPEGTWYILVPCSQRWRFPGHPHETCSAGRTPSGRQPGAAASTPALQAPKTSELR